MKYIKELRLTLPVPVSENHAYTFTRHGKILNARAKQWMTEAESIVTKEIKRQRWETTEKVKVIVEITTYWPDRRIRDTHNSYKICLDSLENAKVFDNDRYAIVRQVDFFVDKENPRIELRIYKMEETV